MRSTPTYFRFLILAACLCPLGLRAADEAPDAAAFDQSVKPLFEGSCVACHNAGLKSGNLSLAGFMKIDSVGAKREEWERIVHKVRTGEMPPNGIPRPPEEEVAAFINVIDKETDRIDSNTPVDPGRVTARRLNRREYSNTIRDLLGVSFDATGDFPSDDLGYGFDNIGDVLTISPVLMEKYMSAAEAISRRAIGADPLPAKPIEAEYQHKDGTIQRINESAIEARHRVDWDAEYTIRIGLPGERPEDAAPVELGFFMDGKLLHKMMVETKPSGLVYFNPFSVEEMRLFLPAGDHTFRAAFLNDHFTDGMSRKDAFDRDKNKFLESITFVGPFPTDVIPESRKMILTCDPASGRPCVESIMRRLTRRAYRRPVTDDEVEALVRFSDMALKEGLSPEQGVQLSIQAMLVSPNYLFRIEKDPDPLDPTAVHRVSDIELASRLSYFLWNSMPDDKLLTLAEQNKLHEPATLQAQVDRMLADDRSGEMAKNFAGQWLEIRNLDSVNPDPEKFPEWGPELREAMRTESLMFFDSVLRENRPMSDFIDADYTFLNGPLAKHYGIEGVNGPDFRRVKLETAERGGVLGQAGVLTVTSYPTRTSPVIRGKYVLEQILGTPPPPPPPNVPPLDEQSLGPNATMREKLDAHRSSPICASCHNRMDNLGFGLENYDAIGRWRTKDGEAAGRFERRAAQRRELPVAGGDAQDPARGHARIRARDDRKNADFRSGQRLGAL